MKINRIWALSNKWTFKIQPIKELLNKYNVGKDWIDPFCGNSYLCEIRNDLNPKNKIAQYHLEALEFVNILDKKYSGAIFDPQYSLTQVSRSYENLGIKSWNKNNKSGGFPKVKDRISQIIKTNGITISFGWNSVGMGKGRNFEIIEILLVCHGGNKNDTICTVEKKTKRRLIGYKF